MAQAKTFKFSDVAILIGDGASPTEAFAAPCGLTQMGMTLATNSNQTDIPDCDNVDDAIWSVTDITSVQMTLSGQGVLDQTARVLWEAWAFSGTEKNVRWMYDVLLANHGGYYSAPAVLTNYQVSGQRGQRVTVQVAINLNGKPVFTPASA